MSAYWVCQVGSQLKKWSKWKFNALSYDYARTVMSANFAFPTQNYILKTKCSVLLQLWPLQRFCCYLSNEETKDWISKYILARGLVSKMGVKQGTQSAVYIDKGSNVLFFTFNWKHCHPIPNYPIGYHSISSKDTTKSSSPNLRKSKCYNWFHNASKHYIWSTWVIKMWLE